MASLKEYKEAKKKLEKLEAEIMEAVCQNISKMKNPKGVRSVGTSGCCVVVSSSALSPECWAPSYYNTKDVAQAIVSKLKTKKNLDDGLDFLKKIISEKKFDGDRVHPSVISGLSAIVSKYE